MVLCFPTFVFLYLISSNYLFNNYQMISPSIFIEGSKHQLMPAVSMDIRWVKLSVNIWSGALQLNSNGGIRKFFRCICSENTGNERNLSKIMCIYLLHNCHNAMHYITLWTLFMPLHTLYIHHSCLVELSTYIGSYMVWRKSMLKWYIVLIRQWEMSFVIITM